MLLFPRHRIVLVFISVSCLSAVSQTALANPVPWNHPDGTVHWYECISTGGADVTWEEARAAAPAGYDLATSTSAEENAFIASLFPGDPGTGQFAFLGGFQPSEYPEPPFDEGWEWITGEDWAYTNWLPPEEPNNVQNEDLLVMYFSNDPALNGRWSDHRDEDLHWYYVIESPEPGTLCLLLLGGVVVLRRRR